MLTPCPKTPNCVSSVDTDRRHYVRPLQYSDKSEDARGRLLAIISEIERSRIVKADAKFIHAEFTSRLFRFIDDVEFYFDDLEKVIHLKSASRTGLYDLGINRRRVESIRKRFENKNKN